MWFRRGLFGLLAAAVLMGCAAARPVKAPPRLYPRVDFGEDMTTLPPRPVAFVRRATFPQFPRAFPILKTQEVPLKERRQLAVRLLRILPTDLPAAKLEAELAQIEHAPLPTLSRSQWFEIRLGRWLVSVWQDGTFHASDESESDIPDRPAPTEAHARALADAFLPRLQPLLPGPVRFSKVSPGWEASDLGILRYDVSYQAQENGLPVQGATIMVASGPRIVMVVCELPRAAVDGEAPLLSPEEAFERFEKGEGVVWEAPWHQAATAYVDSVKLVYPVWHQAHLMPLYEFSGQAPVEGQKHANWVGVIEAVRPERLEPEVSRRRTDEDGSSIASPTA